MFRPDLFLFLCFLFSGVLNIQTDLMVKVETAERNFSAVSPAFKIDKIITLNVLEGSMQYDQELINAKAGTTIQIILNNPDFMQHNLVIIQPGTLKKVGAAADLLAQQPNGADLNYVPKMPEVLASTPQIDPGGKYTLTFKVPAKPGDYPYVCTFPGHWQIMNGILKVTK